MTRQVSRFALTPNRLNISEYGCACLEFVHVNPRKHKIYTSDNQRLSYPSNPAGTCAKIYGFQL